MDATATMRARRTKWSQFGLLYAVALLFTLVPHTAAWMLRPADADASITTSADPAPEPLEDVAFDHLVHGRLDEAIAAAETALASAPTARAQGIKANALMERHWASKSKADLEQATALVRTVPQVTEAAVLSARGNLALTRNDLPGALALLRQAVAASPEDPYAHHQLGFALTQTKQFDDAVVHLGRALTLAPGMAWVQANLQVTLTALGRCEEPLPGLHANVVAACSTEVGVARFNERQFAAALDLFERAVALEPSVGLYHANLASALLQTGSRTRAVAEAQQARALGVTDHPVFSDLGSR